MKLVTANKLNRLWKNGVLTGLAKKVDSIRVLKTVEAVTANTNAENVPSAVVVGELYNNLVSDVYVGSDGKLHKVIGGADTVLPFSSDIKHTVVAYASFIRSGYNQGTLTVMLLVDGQTIGSKSSTTASVLEYNATV